MARSQQPFCEREVEKVLGTHSTASVQRPGLAGSMGGVGVGLAIVAVRVGVDVCVDVDGTEVALCTAVGVAVLAGAASSLLQPGRIASATAPTAARSRTFMLLPLFGPRTL